MANIKEVTTRDGKRWDVRWRLPNGRDRQKRFVSKRDAQAWLRKVTAAPVDTLAGRTTFDVVAAEALLAKPLKPSTLKGYEGVLATRLLPTFGGMKIAKVSRGEVIAWLGEMNQSGVAASTVRGYVVTLSKVMRYAAREGLIVTNPMDGLTPPMKPRPDTAARFLSAAEVDKLALCVSELGEAAPMAVLVKFAAWTGLRAGELTALNIADVNLRRGVVGVRRTMRKRSSAWDVTTPKSLRSHRDVPLAPHVVEWLTDYLATHPRQNDGAAPLWPGRVKGGDRHGEIDWTKRHEHASFYRWHFVPATVACGLSPLRFHDLRHTFASLCAEAGVPIHKVSRWMGHANVATTDMIYTHLFADNSEDLAKLTRLAER
jgi:integrase